jgi:serine protease Do
MLKRSVFSLVFFIFAGTFCFGQASVLRDYVGRISISYQQETIDLMNKIKERLEARNYARDARAIDFYLQGHRGTGFVYTAQDGNCYILTNQHVVAHSDNFSITFEKQDGTKTVYNGLRVLAVDDEKDIAILTFENGAKPFARGLSLITTGAEEGATVFAAGFPTVGSAVTWQYTQGVISNASVRLPKSVDNDELFGPFIQHSAQVDPGNSGGPLLVARQGVTANHAVIGINTLSARARQAANYAVPSDQVNAFITATLSRQAVNDQELIERKANEFVNGLRAYRAVYGHIAEFLSNNYVAEYAETAIVELLQKGSRNTIHDVDRAFSNDPIEGMRIAVAWFVESKMRTRSGTLKVSLESATPNDKGGFTVAFKVNDITVLSEWVKEYGAYRMDSYGEIAPEDKVRVEDMERRQAQEKALITEYSVMISAGYAYILEDIGSAFTASLSMGFGSVGSGNIYGGIGFYYAPEVKLLNAGLNLGLVFPIRGSKAAFMPFGELGIGAVVPDSSQKEFGDPFFYFGANGKLGFMLTSSAISGAFLKAYYCHNIFMGDSGIPNHGLIGVCIGYGWNK